MVWWLEKGQAISITVAENHPNSIPTLAYVLSRSSIISWIDLQNLKFTDELAKKLGDALKERPKLATIGLCRIEFDSNVLGYLVEALKLQNGLRELKICESKLADQDMRSLIYALPDHKELKLDLRNNELEPVNIQDLFSALQEKDNVRHLAFCEEEINQKSMRAIGDYLKKCSNLKNLIFYKNKCAPEGWRIFADALTENCSMSDVTCDYNKFGSDLGAGLKNILKNNRTILKFHFVDNGLGPKDLVEIFSGLKENSQLKKIYLSYSKFNKEAALALVSVLQKNTSLHYLCLCHSVFESPEVGEMLCNAMSGNTTIKELSFYGSDLSPEHQTRIEDLYTRNRAAKRSMEEAAFVYSRIQPSVAFPTELGALLANHVLMLSRSETEYESVTTDVALSIRALETGTQHGQQSGGASESRTQKVPEGCVLV
ncbi:hypothetical protein KTQ42_10665|uniref:hypothetical protein n=1 Tax=Noviherbaspirillum sp. L7-7A TaxID=2850560 RepID=UPI001C2B9799|nr:hypothetical protein [Noviherbaspirillum sp. L7-7A]MBV0879764.1 hypothetical protein [Noviherbaspirillum sp. L7-7A]